MSYRIKVNIAFENNCSAVIIQLGINIRFFEKCQTNEMELENFPRDHEIALNCREVSKITLVESTTKSCDVTRQREVS